MQIIDLFSGIGGFSLAGRWVGWETVQFCEIDSYCQKVLQKHWPDVPVHDNIKTLTYEKIKQNGLWKPGEPTIVVGGFPCQPFSQAGKRKGTKDNRYLWPEMLRIISEVKPAWVVGENVAGLLSMENGRTFETILASLENEGYTVESYLIPACGVGAGHRRDRVWICAHAINDTDRRQRRAKGKAEGIQGINREAGRAGEPCGTGEIFQPYVTNPDSARLQTKGAKQQTARVEQCGELGVLTNPNATKPKSSKCEGGGYGITQKFKKRKQSANGSWWQTEPGVGRVVDGLPNRVDRIKALGNAIVPQVAYEIFKAIKSYEDEKH